MGSVALARGNTRKGSNIVSVATLEGLDDLSRLSGGIKPQLSGGETSEGREDKSCVSVCPDADVLEEVCSAGGNGKASNSMLGRRGSSRKCLPSLAA